MKMIHSQQGVTALLVVLVLASSVLVMAVSASFLGIGELDLGYTSQKGTAAFTLAEGCMQDTLNNIRRDDGYGNFGVNVYSSNIETCSDQTTCTTDVSISEVGTNRMVVVGASVDKNSGQTIQYLRFAGVDCNEIVSQSRTPNHKTWLYYCDTLPASEGTYSVDVVFAPTITDIVLSGVALFNAHNAPPTDVNSKTVTSVSGVNTDVTSMDDDLIIDVVTITSNDPSLFAGTSQDITGSAIGADLHTAMSSIPGTTGNNTMHWSTPGINDFMHIAASFANDPIVGFARLDFQNGGTCNIKIIETNGGGGRNITVTAALDSFIKKIQADITIDPVDGTITLDSFEEV